MYVCMFVCASAHAYAFECICAQIVGASAHTCALVCFVCVYNYLFAGLKKNRLCICASVSVPVYVCMYVCSTYVHMNVFMHACIYVYMCACMYVCMYLHTYA
jgi:hypothetical protein